MDYDRPIVAGQYPTQVSPAISQYAVDQMGQEFQIETIEGLFNSLDQSEVYHIVKEILPDSIKLQILEAMIKEHNRVMDFRQKAWEHLPSMAKLEMDRQEIKCWDCQHIYDTFKQYLGIYPFSHTSDDGKVNRWWRGGREGKLRYIQNTIREKIRLGNPRETTERTVMEQHQTIESIERDIESVTGEA